MNILAIDSSAKAASAAVVSEEAVLASFHLDVKLTHSQTLMPMCQQVLACAGLTMAWRRLKVWRLPKISPAWGFPPSNLWPIIYRGLRELPAR